MNNAEATALAEKIMHADKVIHLQQLSIAWRPPSDAIFEFLKQRNNVSQNENDGASNNNQNSAM